VPYRRSSKLRFLMRQVLLVRSITKAGSEISCSENAILLIRWSQVRILHGLPSNKSVT